MMNKIYRIIWNSTLGQWIVASELGRGKKKNKSRLGNRAAALVLGGLSSLCSLDAFATDYDYIGLGHHSDITILNPGDRVIGNAAALITLMGTDKFTATGASLINDGYLGIHLLNTTELNLIDTDLRLTAADGYGILASDGSSVNIVNGSISTGFHGITGHGATLVVNGTTVSTTGDNGSGITAFEQSSMELTNVNIHTLGQNAYGAMIHGYNSNGIIKGSAIATEGESANGIYFAGVFAEITDTDITTKGKRANGVLASGGIPGQLTINGGTIATQGEQSNGVMVESAGPVKINDTRIDVSGNGAHGVWGSSSTNIELNNADISVSGDSGGQRVAGILATTDSVTIAVNNTNVLASGNGSDGIRAERSGAIVVNGGTVKATGNNGVAVRLDGEHSPVLMTINDALLNTTGDNGSAVYLSGQSKAVLNNVTASTSGIDAAGIVIDRSSLSASVINLQNSSVSSLASDGMLVSAALGEINLTATDIFGGGGNALNVDNASQLTLNANSSQLSGNLNVSADSRANVNLSNDSLLKGATHNVTVLNMDNSQWQMSADSDLGALNVNDSVVSFNVPELGAFKTLTTGSLAGNGSTFILNTVLNDGDINTQSDKIHVTGDATGEHRLVVNNSGGLGALTVGDGIQVVAIDGASSSSFKLGSTVSAGAYEYLLYEGGSTDVNDWYLRSYLQPLTSDPIPDNVISYRPEVAGYIAAPYLNQQYGFDTIGTLHERLGDDVTHGNNDTWSRMGGQHRTDAAGRFGYRGNSWFVQFGSDLYQNQTDTDTAVSSGLMVTMGTQNTDVQDHARSLNPTMSVNTGNVVSDALSLGGYYTRMAQDNSYLDLVGQGTYYHNKYESNHRATQNGYGAALSGEVGKPFALGGNVILEPQAQLIYQYLYLDSFNDGVSTIDSTSSHSGLARGGLRLVYDEATVKPYVVADVVQRLGGNTSVGIGGTDVSADFSDGWWQTGAGVSVQLADDTQMYADAKYQRGFDGGMEGYTGHLGIKVSF
ncbi:autotransporter outer membrane beta-barrel domain-containing protein [Budvicia diplopodorum]|uniref:autotransporter outer membrane beta-barrel domain-containing protein n=1 Tax=Budvicia diplopodorum TaxID=1119056 RepID=UPI0013586348|nr:autotransporter outer membrane beta-barrel domain-containing protein [Budvicia diplopodorum]